MRAVTVLVLFLAFMTHSTAVKAEILDPVTTIVILNGEAVLAEVDEFGDVVKRYIDYPDYFLSEKTHEEKVEEAIAHYAFLKKHQIDQIRFVAFSDDFANLNETAVANLMDIGSHFSESYANEVKITAAVREGNKKIIDETINRIKFTLQTFGVAEEDILVIYKKDVGEEPTQFIKVQSSMR